MKKLFIPLAAITIAMFAYATLAIARAPYEASLGLVQKIFYFHVPSWFGMAAAILVCGVASVVYLFSNRPGADHVAVAAAEIAVLFGLMGLVTGPLWGRKSWGIWWPWDARTTTALLLELVFISYLLVRAYGGLGSDKLAAAVGLFGTAVSPFVYFSVNIWRTIHPLNTVVSTLSDRAPAMVEPFAVSSLAFLLLFVVLLVLRTNLSRQQASLDALYLAQGD